MTNYIIRRLIYAVVTVFGISVISFIIIELPPGDFLSAVVQKQSALNGTLTQAQIADLKTQYGLDSSLWEQYWRWIVGILTRGDFGQSFATSVLHPVSVSSLIVSRLPLTIALAFATLIFTWIVAVPIGIYSAARQYSFGDYTFTHPRLPRPRDPELPAGARPALRLRSSTSARASAASSRPSTSTSAGASAAWSTCSRTCGSR